MIQQQVPLCCQSVCLHPAWLPTTLKSVILNAAATFHVFIFRQAFVFFQSVLYHTIKHLDLSIPKNIKKTSNDLQEWIWPLRLSGHSEIKKFNI